MDSDALRADLRKFIKQNFIFDDNRALEDGQSLLGTGVVDSTGILELISFLEEKLQIRFADSELTAENFDSVDRILKLVAGKVKA